jgi:hypothetical protein
MVTRGESCSRTGVNALGILYDCYFEHTAGLGLVSLFLTHADAQVAYYCNSRESCPRKEFIECLSGTYGTQFGGLVLDPSLEMDWTQKWPNRGDSVLLDYL